MTNSILATNATNNYDNNQQLLRLKKFPCLNCKKSRKKCNGNEPCERCNKSNLKCEYVNFQGAYFFNSRVDSLFDRLEALEDFFFRLKYKVDFGKFPKQASSPNWTTIRYTLKNGETMQELHPLSFFHYRLELSESISKNNQVKLYTNSMIPLPFQCLFELFKLYLHPLYPFINLEKLSLLLERGRYDSPLLISVICRAYQFSLTFDLIDGMPRLEDLPLYQLAITQLKVQSRMISLDMVQAYAVIAFLELNEDRLIIGSQHLSQAISLATQLGLNNWLNEIPSNETTAERASTWIFLQYLEQFYYLCVRKPKTIKYSHLLTTLIDVQSDSNGDAFLDSALLLNLNYPKVHQVLPITPTANLNTMLNYHHYVYFSQSLFKIKVGFKPNLATPKEIEKLNGLRAELKQLIQLKFEESAYNPMQLTLNYFKEMGFGYLINYCLFTIILLDINELLLLYYHEDLNIKSKLDLDQRKLSLQTIELLMPRLNDEVAEYDYVNRLDPLISQTLFHCLKSILKNHFKINLNYFKGCVLGLLESNRYWEGNINIEAFFSGFQQIPILKKVLRMIKYEENNN